METDAEDPQFDSYLGGQQHVPSGVNVSEFIKHRMEEVVMLTEAIEESPFRGQAFQRLPKHMRRRQMSHYIKRLPRRLQRPYLMSLKDGPPAPTKRPSRKYRRRPGNLLLDYNRRQRNSIWLETHIWHAKRFHMTSRWGYKLPERPVNKTFKACYRAIAEHCLLFDMSYYNCIELQGPCNELLEGLKQCTSPECGLTFAAKTYLSGTREGHVTLFHPNSYPYRAIGNVTFMWQPQEGRIWIWVHPLMHDEVVECFKLLFDLKENGAKYQNGNIVMSLLRNSLNRFRLTGPLSQATVTQAFTLAKPGLGDNCWWNKYQTFNQNVYSMLSGCTRPSDLPPGVILGMIVEDPRLGMPPKREKAVPKTEDGRQIPMVSDYSQSPIWSPEIRDEVFRTKLSTYEINQARSKKIVPGFDAKDVIPDKKQSRIPILLVQRPGKQDGRLGLGSGWDIISPSGFGMPIWLSLLFRGARTGGLRESELLQLESQDFDECLPPDSAAGQVENHRKYQNLKEEHFKLPPDKRPNYIKLGVASPFQPLWGVLVRDWLDPQTDQQNFCILRSKKLLKQLNDTISSGDEHLNLPYPTDSLIPISIEYTGKGKPKDLALICVPNDEDFQTTPTEPSHPDENKNPRKLAKLEHSKLLKKLKRKRKKFREKLKKDFSDNLPGQLKWKEILKTNSDPSEPHSKEYNERMERLWVPDGVETLVGTSSRRIAGFVVKGEFSYATSRGVGLGYVSLPGLVEVLRVCRRNKSKSVVLVRNRNQAQYRFGGLKIAMS